MAQGSITVQTLRKMKRANQKIAMMTAYDYPTAHLLDASGLHVLLVGDSLGMVVQGRPSTIPVTLDDIVYHSSMVARAATHAMVVADMPFMTYKVSSDVALQNAARLMSQGNAHAVKVEGAGPVAATVQRMVAAGIPVMGHLGLTPQSVHAIGGFFMQGKTATAAAKLMEEALALQSAGVFSLVLEMVPAEVAAWVTARLDIPTIGIGAGAGCDGQVLVFHDFAGYTSAYIPKHNKRYINLAEVVQQAARDYVQDVAQGKFPGEEQVTHLKEGDGEAILTAIETAANSNHAAESRCDGGAT